MTVLIGYCDLLSGQSLGPLNKAQLDALHVIRERSDSLLRLLNDVLDFSQIVSGELQVDTKPVSLLGLVQAVVEKYSPHTERKNQTVLVEIPAPYRYLIANERRLYQVLGHLVENAIKFSDHGRQIKILARSHDPSFVRVDIIDQGIGIKPEDMPRLFEDFRQLDSSFTREYGGAGLGLAIAKHLIELQGGVLWVESEFGVGSTFSFVLPGAVPPGR
jgi:signal transduction histidine kinase